MPPCQGASDAPARAPECGGFLSSWLGQCYTPGPEVAEVELWASPKAGECGWWPNHPIPCQDHETIVASSGARLALSGSPGRFLVDNSVLQIHGRTGIRYRYSKCMKDKVRSENPAFWGEVVQGVDEGDDWLRVGRYYLPMRYQGIQVLTPVLASPLRLLGSRLSAPFGAAEKPAAPPQGAHEAVPRHSPPLLPPGAVPERQSQEQQPLASLGADIWPQKMEVVRETPAALEVPLVTAAPPSVAALPSEWRVLPSVGTWLQMAPCKASAPAVAAEPEKRVADEDIPHLATKHSAVDGRGTPELALFADIVKSAKLQEDGTLGGADGVSPSTCAPESPNSELLSLETDPQLTAA